MCSIGCGIFVEYTKTPLRTFSGSAKVLCKGNVDLFLRSLVELHHEKKHAATHSFAISLVFVDGLCVVAVVFSIGVSRRSLGSCLHVRLAFLMFWDFGLSSVGSSASLSPLCLHRSLLIQLKQAYCGVRGASILFTGYPYLGFLRRKCAWSRWCSKRDTVVDYLANLCG